MQERRKEDTRAVFESSVVSEARRFRSRMGDSAFRGSIGGEVLEGAKDYLGLNGDNPDGEHLVFMRAANRLLTERGIDDVAVEVKVIDEVVYSPDGEEKRQNYWRAYLLRKAQNGNQA